MNIFRHTLTYGFNYLNLPIAAQFLDFQVLNDYLTIWTLVPKEAPCQERTILVCYTGENTDLHTYDIYLGTVQHDGLVYHAFELL